MISGTVREVLSSGGYTYVLLEREGEKVWVAMPEAKMKVGEKVSLGPGVFMSNFKSNTLHRTFDSIIFSTGPAALPGSKDDASRKKTAAVSAEKISVDKAEGDNAYTVADLYRNSSKLDKKEVLVRGKVVKVSTQIMGKNWVHIQDGSGSADRGNNNLVVTIKDSPPSIGDIVIAKGVLTKDKDFGYGYKYDVILDNASVKKQEGVK
ncbi:MAG: DNA-binding protein [Nitrospirota bacterium]